MYDSHVYDAVSATQSFLLGELGLFVSRKAAARIFRESANQWSKYRG